MSSTLKVCLAEVKANPKKVHLLHNVIEELINDQITINEMIKCVEDVIVLLAGYFDRITLKSHNATYSALQAYLVSLIKIILFHLSSSPQVLVSLIEQIVGIAPTNLKDTLIALLLQQIISREKVLISSINNCQLISSILRNCDSLIINKHYEAIIQFILKVKHLNALDAESCIIVKAKIVEDNMKQFKTQYQRVVLDVLEVLELNSQSEFKARVYRRLGDRVFSKLACPLVLAQYLLKKFETQYEDPQTQVQVLSCLFILVGKQGLQMQQFYHSLEHMIESKRKRSLFNQRNSRRFLKLVESALRSSRVPFQHVLNLSRLIVQKIFTENSQFAFWALAFLVNLVKKHRQLQAHLHTIPQLQLLKSHYSPKIRSLLSQLQRDLNKVEYLDIEQFGKIDCEKLCHHKIQSLCDMLSDNEYLFEFEFSSISPHF